MYVCMYYSLKTLPFTNTKYKITRGRWKSNPTHGLEWSNPIKTLHFSPFSFIPHSFADSSMAAATTHFAPSISASSAKTLKHAAALHPLAPSSLSFLSSSSSGLNALKAVGISAANGIGSALGARMVSVPAIKPLISLDFDTSVFKKEKVNLAGHDEVFLPFFLYYIYIGFEWFEFREMDSYASIYWDLLVFFFTFFSWLFSLVSDWSILSEEAEIFFPCCRRPLRGSRKSVSLAGVHRWCYLTLCYPSCISYVLLSPWSDGYACTQLQMFTYKLLFLLLRMFVSLSSWFLC